MNLGEVIKNSRLAHNMTQGDLAKALGTTKATVSRWESNQVYNFKHPMIAQICKTLDLDPFFFFQQYNVITAEENRFLNALRAADSATKAAVAKLLDIQLEDSK